MLWTDGWKWQQQTGYSYIDYQTIYDYVKQISPNTLLLENNHEYNLSHTDIAGYEQNPLPPMGNTVPERNLRYAARRQRLVLQHARPGFFQRGQRYRRPDSDRQFTERSLSARCAARHQRADSDSGGPNT